MGCLAVFQVAGSDARQLVWELGKDRVSEDDIVSLPVHHCYVRATVGKERMPAFSMMVRKPEPGEPDRADRIRAATEGYTVPARQVEYGNADGHKKVDDYRKGVEELEEEAKQENQAENEPEAEQAPQRKKQRSRRRTASENAASTETREADVRDGEDEAEEGDDSDDKAVEEDQE